MNKPLETIISKFVSSIHQPTLLALSGGPDSMALFHLLRANGGSFHVAHVDHNWRKESRMEGDLLKKMCESHAIPFHLKTLDPTSTSGNLEEFCREERFQFFGTLCHTWDLHGVFLAHHADDQAETLLKRLFEGANLIKLKGLQPISQYKGLKLFRPLLGVRKNEILKWLTQNQISYFHDDTNEDCRFLRSRMRKSLLPILSREFGKEVVSSLCRIGNSVLELNDWIEDSLVPYRAQIYRSNGYKWLSFKENLPSNPFLLKMILLDFFEKENVVLSQFTLDSLVTHLKGDGSRKTIRVKKKQVIINKKILSLSELDIFDQSA